MKRNLLALALLASLAGTAFAQSNVTIYGIVDNGFIKETGSDITMGQNVLNRIGFKGSEDLGRGYKATFQLEKRFTLNDGAPQASSGMGQPMSESPDRSGPYVSAV